MNGDDIGVSIHTYRYGESGELPGLSIGVTRLAPRGVRKEDRASKGYFDLWLPLLGPGRELLRDYRSQKISFVLFARRYRAEMKRPEPRQLIALLAAMGKARRINLGCHCVDPALCHRTLLRELIIAEIRSGESPYGSTDERTCSSPPCYGRELSREGGKPK